MNKTASLGELIPSLLKSYDVQTVFGIPGVHTIEMYRGMPGSSIDHITPRHEQGAGFMADGYARVSGKPGVCFIITGPGLTNIATAMAQALQDSIPMLVISSVNSRKHLALGEGRLHELDDQQGLMAKVSRYSHTLLEPENLPKVLARAFAIMTSQRPGPVHIEIPIDVLHMPAGELDISSWPMPELPSITEACTQKIVALVRGAKTPVLVVGGGARQAGLCLQALADHLALPIINTTNGKGVVAKDHPLSLGGSPSSPPVKKLLSEQADVILAFGTEFGETDYDFYFTGRTEIAGKIIRIDIDCQQLYSNVQPFLPIHSDAGHAAEQILKTAKEQPACDRHSAKALVRNIKTRLSELRDPNYFSVFAAIDDCVPEAIVVADSCQPSYYACEYYETQAPNHYFHSASGYGTLGYAIPAAIGAQLAAKDKQVVCISGDGGSQFSATDLISAVEAKTPVIFIIWMNHGHQEIRNAFVGSEIPKCGVDIAVPNYGLLAQSMGLNALSANTVDELRDALKTAYHSNKPSLICAYEDSLINHEN